MTVSPCCFCARSFLLRRKILSIVGEILSIVGKIRSIVVNGGRDVRRAFSSVRQNCAAFVRVEELL